MLNMQTKNNKLIAPAPAVAPINVNPNEIGDLNKTLLSYYTSHTEKQDKIIRDLKQENELLKQENELLSKGIEPAIFELKEFWQTHGTDDEGNNRTIKDVLYNLHNEILHFSEPFAIDRKIQNNCFLVAKVANILGKLNF
jgi:hypothetical protein